MNVRKDPVIIGALGGSGTRVFTRIARHAGIFMGSRLNSYEDSEPIIDFYDAWASPYLQVGGCLPDAAQKTAEDKFFECLEHHLVGLPAHDSPWGVKVPKSILMIRFWCQIFPDAKFIHVIRSGLDMTYSADHNQLHSYGDLVLSQEEQNYSPGLKAISYWCNVNLSAASFGEADLEDRYLRIRFEDLCTEPVRIVGQLFDFLKASDRSTLPAATAEVSFPETIGRWRTHPVEEVYEIMRVGRPGLERFRYWNPLIWQELGRAMEGPRLKRWFFQRTAMKHLPAW